jgi:uncharacterized damage-inducible protein DinB
MTVDTARLLARYNAHANTEMNKVLSQLSEHDWTKDLGGFYPSFRALATHLYTTDVAWLGRFAGLRPFASIEGEVFDFPPAPGEPPFHTIAEYVDKRQKLDAVWSGFTAELTDADLAADLNYRNYKNENLTKNVGALVLHIFNHQTHHRGMIALYLDQLDIPNDYSSLSAVV